ncbi:hypothetical protein TNIN_45871 [Trichonephila inaurata madagascariensis]|uniref:Uncharacterized protein n=1 Tax=Trichonephila inaurata madagascariensis TaxID=2747483 RepID=A0A8X6WQ51_9ARAC|nr:hypothetical protein TNIN_45871 [Trichonephila inaurata madagascariensis]
MCLPNPVCQKAYDRINTKIADVSEALANALMKKATAEEKIIDGTVNSVVVSGDGTWKTCGHTSLIGANSQNVNEMRQAVWAHTSSTDDEPKHWFCPKGKNS